MRKLPVFLASQSPRRALILKQIGLPFKIINSNFVEHTKTRVSSEKEASNLVLENAKGKALSAAQYIDRGFIIGVDTVILYKNTILR